MPLPKRKKVNVMDFDKKITYNEDEIKKLPFGHQRNHREMGWKNLRGGQYEAAIRSLHQAAAVEPNDVRTLIGRSYARAKIMLYEGANEDAQAVLRQDSYDKDAIFLEAHCANDLGFFEQSLLMYRRGVNKRGRRRQFIEGQQALEATLENTVGCQSGSAMTDLTPAIKEMQRQEERHKELNAQTKRDCLDELYDKTETRCSDEDWFRFQRRLQRQDRKLANIYLGKLSEDREWCKVMTNTKSFKKSDPTIQQIIEWTSSAGIELDKLLENLYSRKPLYHFFHRFKSCQGLADKQQAKYTQTRQLLEEQDLKRKFAQLRKFIMEESYREAIFQADRIKDKLDNTHKNYLPKKKKLLEELSAIMCSLYLEFNKLRRDLSKEDNRLRINCIFGLDQAYLEMGMNSFIQRSKFPFLHYPERLFKFKEHIRGATSSIEKAWLHYEVASVHGFFQRWDYLVQEASKCAAHAEECGAKMWVVTALLLIIKGEIQRRDRAEAMKVLKECLELAKEIDLEDTIAYILEIQYVIGQAKEWGGTLDVRKAIQKRENAIITNIKNTDTKEKMRDILARMRSLPQHRRMGLIPGLAAPTTKCKESSNKSIIPGGIGGRLGMHPVTDMTYKEFLNLPSH